MSPRTWAGITKLKASGSGEYLFLGEQGLTNPVGPSIWGVPTYTTSQLSVTETQGSSSVASSVYVLQADQVLLVRRADFEVLLDRSRLFNQDMTEVRGIGRFDLIVPNPKAIVRISGAL